MNSCYHYFDLCTSNIVQVIDFSFPPNKICHCHQSPMSVPALQQQLAQSKTNNVCPRFEFSQNRILYKKQKAANNGTEYLAFLQILKLLNAQSQAVSCEIPSSVNR